MIFNPASLSLDLDLDVLPGHLPLHAGVDQGQATGLDQQSSPELRRLDHPPERQLLVLELGTLLT
jgi:hypothetical protein